MQFTLCAQRRQPFLHPDVLWIKDIVGPDKRRQGYPLKTFLVLGENIESVHGREPRVIEIGKRAGLVVVCDGKSLLFIWHAKVECWVGKGRAVRP